MTISTQSLKTLTVAIFLVMSSGITAQAQNQPSSFEVVTTTNGKINAGVAAYKRGDFEKAAMFMRSSLKDGLSKSRQTIAQSNLCAIYGAMKETHRASEACKKALELRPDYSPALANNNTLKIKYAQK